MAIPIKTTLKVSSQTFTTGIRLAGKAVGGLVAVTKFATIAVTALAGSFALLITRQAALIDRIGKVSKVTGVGAETLQKFSFAAEQAGVGTDQAQVALRRFSRRLGEAQKGAGELLPALKKLDIDVRNADGSFKSAEEVLFEFADGIANTDDATQRLALAFKAFDSEGAELVNTLMGGAAGLQEMFSRAEALGAVLSTSAIQGVEDFNDSFNELQTLTTGVANAFTAELAPALEQITKDITELILKIAEDKGGFDGFAKFLKNEFIDLLKEIVKIFGAIINKIVELGRAVPFQDLFPVDPKVAEEYNKVVDALDKIKDASDGVMSSVGRVAGGTDQFLALVKGKDTAQKLIDALKTIGFETSALQSMYNNITFTDRLIGGEDADRFNEALKNAIVLAAEVGDQTGIIADNAGINVTNTLKYLDTLKAVGTTSVETVKEFKVATTETNRELDLTLGYFERIILQIGDFFTRDFPQKIKETIELLKSIFKTVQERLLEMTNPIKTIEDGLVKAGKAFEDALVDAILTGKSSFEDFRNILRETFARAIVQKFITEPIFGLFKAKGGPVSAGQPYIVGEQGPELFMPGASGTIIPNNNLQGSGGAGSGQVTYNINAVDAASFKTLVARDPEFIYNVSRAGSRRVPG